MSPINVAGTRNPALQNIATLLEAAGGEALRAAKGHRTDYVYVWDAADVLHRPMLQHLGLIMGNSLGVIWSVEQARNLLKG